MNTVAPTPAARINAASVSFLPRELPRVAASGAGIAAGGGGSPGLSSSGSGSGSGPCTSAAGRLGTSDQSALRMMPGREVRRRGSDSGSAKPQTSF